MTKLVAVAVSIFLFFAGQFPAQAIAVDISNLAGFTSAGVSGTGGNGVVFLSPNYSFPAGQTIDFGTAIVQGDPYDFRQGPCNNFCFGSGGVLLTSFLKNGIGGVPVGTFDLFGTGEFNVFPFFVVCVGPDAICPPSVYSLDVTIPNGFDGVQFAFEGASLEILPPASAPLPATLPLFLTGLFIFGLTASRRTLFTRVN